MQKGERTRHAILEEAMGLASVVGLEGLSIGHLASHTGLSKSGLFAHFGSKEELQIQTLQEAGDLFRDTVVRPALKESRGLARVNALFERWLKWASETGLPGGCIFVAAAVELDDRPGPARDYLVRRWQDWYDLIARTAEFAVQEGDFRADLDCTQFAHELNAIFFSFHHSARLLADDSSVDRARRSFQRLIMDSGK